MLELKTRNQSGKKNEEIEFVLCAGKKNEEIRVCAEKKKKISVRGEKKHKKSVRGGKLVLSTLARHSYWVLEFLCVL